MTTRKVHNSDPSVGVLDSASFDIEMIMVKETGAETR